MFQLPGWLVFQFFLSFRDQKSYTSSVSGHRGLSILFEFQDNWQRRMQQRGSNKLSPLSILFEFQSTTTIGDILSAMFALSILFEFQRSLSRILLRIGYISLSILFEFQLRKIRDARYELIISSLSILFEFQGVVVRVRNYDKIVEAFNSF